MKDENQNPNQSIYLRFADLKRDYSLPQSILYDLIKNNGFPEDKKLCIQSVRFEQADLDKWFAEREEAMGV